MHLRYAFFSEKAPRPNILVGSWVITFGAHLRWPQIDFWSLMKVLSSLFIVGMEKATA